VFPVQENHCHLLAEKETDSFMSAADFDSHFDCAIDAEYLSSHHSASEVGSQFTDACISTAEIGSQLQTFCESITASSAQQSTSTILMQHATPIKPPSLSSSTPHTLQNTGSLANPNRITRRRLCRRISDSFRCVICRESCREGMKTDVTVILDLSAKNHKIPGYTRPVAAEQTT
jgi:hypothetical protein